MFSVLRVIRKLYLVVVRELRYNSVSSTVAKIALWLTIVSVHLISGYIFPSLFVIIAISGESPLANLGDVEP